MPKKGKTEGLHEALITGTLEVWPETPILPKPSFS